MKILCPSSVPFVKDYSSTRDREIDILNFTQVIEDINVFIVSQLSHEGKEKFTAELMNTKKIIN